MRGELEVLQHRQVGEAAGARRHVGDLALGPAVWGPAADVDVSDADRAGGPGEQANDAQERGRLAGAVAAQQRHQFAVPDTEVEVEDDVALAVADVEPANLEHQKKDPTLVTGAAGRTGFAGPDELSRSPTKRGPPGGGPDPPHEISDFAGTPREGEACLPLHFMAGRTGFAGPDELSRSPTKRGPPGGGPDPPHEISDFAGTPREGEACLPLHFMAGRTGFAGPIELSRWPTKRGPPGGGPDPPHEISDFAGTPREGEACLPLHFMAGRTGFAGPIELSRWPTQRGPPGGGPDPPHEISDFAGTPREGEACLPLHLGSIRPRPRP